MFQRRDSLTSFFWTNAEISRFKKKLGFLFIVYFCHITFIFVVVVVSGERLELDLFDSSSFKYELTSRSMPHAVLMLLHNNPV